MRHLTILLILCHYISLSGQISADSAFSMGKKQTEMYLPDSALLYYNQAVEQYLKSGNQDKVALAKIGMANNFSSKEMYQRAHSILDSVISDKTMVGYPDVIHEAYLIKGSTYKSERKFNLALINYDSASNYTSESNSATERLRQARLNRFYGLTHLRDKNLLKAEALFKESEHIYDSLDVENSILIKLYRDLGSLYIQMRKTDLAIDYLNKSKEIYETEFSSIENYPTAHLYRDLGTAYWLHGLVQGAINYLEESMRIMKEIDARSPYLPRVFMRLASLYNSIEDPVEGGIFAMKALEMSLLVHGEDHFQTAESYFLLGNYNAFTNDLEKALKYYRATIRSLQKMPNGKNEVLLGMATFYLGDIFYNTEREAEGLKRMANGSAIIRKITNGFGTEVTQFSFFLARIYEARNEPDSALRYFHESAKGNSRNFDQNNPLTNPKTESTVDKLYQFRIMVGKAKAYKEKYKLSEDQQWIKAAYQTILAADSAISSMRENLILLKNQFWVSTLISEGMDEGIRICHELYELTNDAQYAEVAFLFGEKNKANHLMAGFNVGVPNPYNIPDSIRNREKDINSSISDLETLIFKEAQRRGLGHEAQIEDYQNKLAELRIELALISNRLKKDYPNYFQLKYDHKYLTVSETRQNLLGKNDLLISYHFDEDEKELYIFRIDKTDFRLDKVPLDKNFEQDIDLLLESLKNPKTSEEDLNQYVQASERLARTLIPDIEHLDKYETIIVLAEDKLSVVPFEILTKKSDNQKFSFNQLHYLVKDHAIRYGLSATMLYQQNQSKRLAKKKKVLTMAPFLDDESLSMPGSVDTVRSALGKLPYTLKEVESIAEHFSTFPLIGKQATEKVFRDISADYSIIHLASHGQVNEQGLFSQLVLSPYETDSINDGFLNMREILEMDIYADLVVLSACNSGSGNIRGGEGVMSLANGFFYAGAKSLVMTLWTANDESTASIINGFYENLADHQSKSVALRGAKLTYLENSNGLSGHPYYWAHLVVNGNNHPIAENNKTWPYYLIGLVLLIALIYQRKRNAHRA